MSGFMGGSAFTMARDISEGYIQVTDRTYRGMSTADLQRLAHELDRHMRELRGEATAHLDTPEVQARQRRILRLRTALMILRHHQQKSRVPAKSRA